MLLVKLGRRWVLGGFTALMLLSLGAQFFWAGRDPMHAYFGTDARLYQLVAGALLAVPGDRGAPARARRSRLQVARRGSTTVERCPSGDGEPGYCDMGRVAE